MAASSAPSERLRSWSEGRTLVVEAELPAPRAAVYRVLSNPETYPEWLKGATRIRGVDPDFPEPGTEFHHSVGVAEGLDVNDATEAVADDTDRHLALMVHAIAFHARVDYFLEDAPGGGTTIRFCERPVGLFGPIAPLLHPLLKLRNEASMRNLRNLVGAHAQPHDG